MFAVPFDNFFFIYLSWSLFCSSSWRSRRQKSKINESKTSNRDLRHQTARHRNGSDEDRIRKLMEALGRTPTHDRRRQWVPRTDIPPPACSGEAADSTALTNLEMARKKRGKPEAIREKMSIADSHHARGKNHPTTKITGLSCIRNSKKSTGSLSGKQRGTIARRKNQERTRHVLGRRLV